MLPPSWKRGTQNEYHNNATPPAELSFREHALDQWRRNHEHPAAVTGGDGYSGGPPLAVDDGAAKGDVGRE